VHADFNQYPPFGCRSDMRIASLNCCVCIDQSPCPQGTYRNKSTCQCASPTPTPTPTPTSYEACYNPTAIQDCEDRGGIWKGCRGCTVASPLVIDTLGNGFNLTSAGTGVDFDIDGDGVRERLSWTAQASDDAWLTLDSNSNGRVDNGTELFGNFTPQPASATPNGFLALSEYDKPANGGNADAVMSNSDAIFPRLRLWQDTNHNGISEAGELKTLPQLGIDKLELDYKESKRVDQYGNQFRYRAKVRDEHEVKVGRWAWDVFLRVAH
jgi:hypothetical protein